MQHLPPPKPLSFSGNVAQNFKNFVQAYKIYMQATGLIEKPEKTQASVFLHVAGEEAIKVFNGFSWREDESKDNPTTIIDKFQQHCTPLTNVIFERHLFYARCQRDNEQFDPYYSDLCNLVKTCEFGGLQEEMVRDRIVSGIKDDHLRRRLLREPKLTLKQAVDQCRATEVSEKHSREFTNHTEANVQYVKKSSDYKKRAQKQHPQQHQPKQHSRSNSCRYCGQGPHDRKECPARRSICNCCQKQGHWKVVCEKSKSVRAVECDDEDQPNQEDVFLGAVSTNEQSKGDWSAEVKVDKIPVVFHADTGADISVIPQAMYVELFGHKKLHTVSRSIRGADHHLLKCEGYFSANLTSSKGISIVEEIYVLQQGSALLSRSACVEMKIVSFVGAVQQDFVNNHPKLFTGLGLVKDCEYNIQIDETVRPYAVSAPRRIPLPLMNKVKKELSRLHDADVIHKVEKPTDWCAPVVVVPKSNGDVRLCVDLTKLNNAVKRERHQMPSVDYTLGQMAGAKYFSKIDANSGFHQIALSPQSAHLTTFITPFGRFCYKRLPFGISSGPEIFQREVSKVLDGLHGVVCQMDDIVVFGSSREEHDHRLEAVLVKLSKAGITLNKNKCEFARREVKFLGQIVGAQGVEMDTSKLEAIQKMPEPHDISALRRFMGMVNQLGKFTKNLTDITEPMRSLLSSKNEWIWETPQRQAFNATKAALTSTPTLAFYDPSAETKISADASSFGLGAVLSQQAEDGWHPVAYASRSLTPTEKRYAQIEKEALAAMWASERFSDYVTGKRFILETDHKPLLSLLGSKDIDQLPIRIQRFRMRLMRFTYDIVHVPGKDLHTADALSRAPHQDLGNEEFQKEVDLYVNYVMSSLPASDSLLDIIQRHQEEDEVCRQVRSYVEETWPERFQLNGVLKQFWPYRADLTMVDGLLMYGSRIFIPSSLRLHILDRIHHGHQGITKCRMRAQQSVWWPGLSQQIYELVNQCRVCAQLRDNHPEPLIPSTMPKLPWEKIASDLFEFRQKQYLLVVDYYSRFIEICQLKSTTSAEIIHRLKQIFARHGIPQTFVSDNGPQYSAKEFSAFATSYGFIHITSSPGHSSGNGEAERAVRTVKQLLKAADDPYLALLSYHSTPIRNGYSPAELLMGRKLRSTIPMAPVNLVPKTPNLQALQEFEQQARSKLKSNFDKRHSAKLLPSLNAGDEVYVPDRKGNAEVVTQCTPTSFIVKTDSGNLRRNRVQLNKLPGEDEAPLNRESPNREPPNREPIIPEDKKNENHVPSGSTVVTRSGRTVKTPARLME